MKIKINAKRFYDGLQSVGRVVSNRNVSPALGYFMLKLSKDELEVTGSDSEIFIQTTLPLIMAASEWVERTPGLPAYFGSVGFRIRDILSTRQVLYSSASGNA